MPKNILSTDFLKAILTLNIQVITLLLVILSNMEGYLFKKGFANKWNRRWAIIEGEVLCFSSENFDHSLLNKLLLVSHLL